jgi:hypothetical protein
MFNPLEVSRKGAQKYEKKGAMSSVFHRRKGVEQYFEALDGEGVGHIKATTAVAAKCSEVRAVVQTGPEVVYQ